MLKKTLTYNNADGVSITDDFYFNMTKAELMEMELSHEGGFKEHLEKIVASGKGADIIAAFKFILKKAYGVRTPDGGFVKSPEEFEKFSATDAYSDLFFELVTDAKKSAEFVNAIMPAQLLAEVEAAKNQQKMIVPNEGRAPSFVPESQLEMTDEELLAGLGIEEPKINGLSDLEILNLPATELRKQPREVLLRAYQLKNQK